MVIMGNLELTEANILHDIKAYDRRLQVAQERLSSLSRGKGRDLRRKRAKIIAEIEHVKTLRGYAAGALLSFAVKG